MNKAGQHNAHGLSPLAAIEVVRDPAVKRGKVAGAVHWDLGRPCQIRGNTQGYGTHRPAESGFCEVYDKRPALCIEPAKSEPEVEPTR